MKQWNQFYCLKFAGRTFLIHFLVGLVGATTVFCKLRLIGLRLKESKLSFYRNGYVTIILVLSGKCEEVSEGGWIRHLIDLLILLCKKSNENLQSLFIFYERNCFLWNCIAVLNDSSCVWDGCIWNQTSQLENKGELRLKLFSALAQVYHM